MKFLQFINQHVLQNFIFLVGFVHIETAVSEQCLRYDTHSNKTFEPVNQVERLREHMFHKILVPFYMEELFSIIKDPTTLDSLFNGVTSNCRAHCMEWINYGMNWNISDIVTKNAWAMQMIDSWGKPPEGLLSGHINTFGDYDECVGIKVTDLETTVPGNENIVKDFNGRYCNTYLVPMNLTFRSSGNNFTLPPMQREAVSLNELFYWMRNIEGTRLIPSMGTCFPSSCSKVDAQQILFSAFKIIYEDYNVSPNTNDLTWPFVADCFVGDKPDFDAGDIAMFVVLGLIVALCIAATFVEEKFIKKDAKPSDLSLPMKLLRSFSLPTNLKKWLSTRRSAEDLGCVHGLKFISTSWIILHHTWFVVTIIPAWNMIDMKKMYEDWSVIAILNGSIAVDTFFVLSGLITGYNLFKVLTKTGSINVPKTYLHRYLRLTPLYAIIVGIMATIVPYLGSGPSWAIMDRWGQFCADNWWTNLLYVNNFVNTTWMCQGEAWYLASDMQFFILSPAFVYPLYRWEFLGIIAMGVWSVLSILCPALLVYFLDTPPTTIGTRDSNKMYKQIYIKPYARIQTYLIGIWLAFILYKTRGKKIKINKFVVIACWLFAAAVALASLYGFFPYYDPTIEIPMVATMFYAGLHRVGWGLSIAWVIFACIKGYGGIVNKFLSWKVFMPLGRLGYGVYLLSLHLQMILHHNFKQLITFEPYSMTNFFFAHMVMSYLVGFIFAITVEIPFLEVERLVFPMGSGPPKVVKPPDEGSPNTVVPVEKAPQD